METLANLESFVRSAESGGFSPAARALGLTPAAVSRNVAALERNLGVRLFHRSTRKLTLTEAGEGFFHAIRQDLESLQTSISAVSSDTDEPSGLLKISVSLTFGLDYIMPLLPAFLERYPRVRPDWRFENRQVDLIAEGYDAAIGGGFDLTPGVIAKPLGPAHVIAVAAPDLLVGRAAPSTPEDLLSLPGVVMRSDRTGRVRHWTMRNLAGEEKAASVTETVVVNDPAAMCRAAALGLGVALVAIPDVLADLQSGALVRLAPRWWADAGPISLYYASRSQMPAKTRVFVDFVTEAFKRDGLAQAFAGSLSN